MSWLRPEIKRLPEARGQDKSHVLFTWRDSSKLKCILLSVANFTNLETIMVNNQLPSDEILRLPLKQLRLKDSVTQQRAFVKALFSVEPREFNDKAGIL